MIRWLLLSVAVLVAGCSPSAVDALPQPTPLPTRPTLELPTRPAAPDLPRIRSSFDLPQPSRTPLASRLDQPDPTPSDGTSTPVADPAPSSTPTADVTPASTSTPRRTATPIVAHRFVASAQARTYYYCDTDSAWKNLSPRNLRWFDSERALKAVYPRLILHRPCD